jgi:hypothetical protein
VPININKGVKNGRIRELSFIVDISDRIGMWVEKYSRKKR